MRQGTGRRGLRRAAAAAGASAARERLHAVDRKYRPTENPLEREDFLDMIQPTNQQQLKRLTELLGQMYQNAPNADVAKAVAMYQTQLAAGTFSDQSKLEFVRHFYFWLLGRGAETDHKNTLWGRGNAAVHNKQVSAYIEAFARKRMEYAMQLALLANRVPETINGYFLYFKYIVRGHLKRVERDGQKFWDLSNDDFLQDFEMFQQVFTDPAKRGDHYGEMIMPATTGPAHPFGNDPGGSQPAGNAVDPYPVTNADRNRWATKAKMNVPATESARDVVNETITAYDMKNVSSVRQADAFEDMPVHEGDDTGFNLDTPLGTRRGPVESLEPEDLFWLREHLGGADLVSALKNMSRSEREVFRRGDDKGKEDEPGQYRGTPIESIPTAKTSAELSLLVDETLSQLQEVEEAIRKARPDERSELFKTKEQLHEEYTDLRRRETQAQELETPKRAATLTELLAESSREIADLTLNLEAETDPKTKAELAEVLEAQEDVRRDLAEQLAAEASAERAGGNAPAVEEVSLPKEEEVVANVARNPELSWILEPKRQSKQTFADIEAKKTLSAERLMQTMWANFEVDDAKLQKMAARVDRIGRAVGDSTLHLARGIKEKKSRDELTERLKVVEKGTHRKLQTGTRLEDYMIRLFTDQIEKEEAARLPSRDFQWPPTLSELVNRQDAEATDLLIALSLGYESQDKELQEAADSAKNVGTDAQRRLAKMVAADEGTKGMWGVIQEVERDMPKRQFPIRKDEKLHAYLTRLLKATAQFDPKKRAGGFF